MGEETQKFKRRTVLIKRSMQLKYAAIVFAAVLFTALIVGVGTYLSIFRLLQQENPALIPDLTAALQLDIAKLVIFLGIMFVVTMFVSHRWAGPIYRFERSAQALSTGDLTHRVSLRTGDELMELQDEINAMVASLQRLVQKDRTIIEQLTTRLDSVLGHLSAEPPAGVELERLREDLQWVRHELQHITKAFNV